MSLGAIARLVHLARGYCCFAVNHNIIVQQLKVAVVTVFPRSDAAATIYFIARFSAATIRRY